MSFCTTCEKFFGGEYGDHTCEDCKLIKNVVDVIINQEFENVCLCCTRLFKVKAKDRFVGVCPDCKKELNKNSSPPSTIKTESYVVVSEYGDICTHTLRPTQDECEAAAISVWGKMWWEGMKKNGAVIKPCIISV